MPNSQKICIFHPVHTTEQRVPNSPPPCTHLMGIFSALNAIFTTLNGVIQSHIKPFMVALNSKALHSGPMTSCGARSVPWKNTISISKTDKGLLQLKERRRPKTIVVQLFYMYYILGNLKSSQLGSSHTLYGTSLYGTAFLSQLPCFVFPSILL